MAYTFLLGSVPPNVSFFIDDLEEEWTFSQKFDFVYARMLTGSIADWPKLIRQSYESVFSPHSLAGVILTPAPAPQTSSFPAL